MSHEIVEVKDNVTNEQLLEAQKLLENKETFVQDVTDEELVEPTVH